jgi:hypothetical protein
MMQGGWGGGGVVQGRQASAQGKGFLDVPKVLCVFVAGGWEVGAVSSGGMMQGGKGFQGHHQGRQASAQGKDALGCFWEYGFFVFAQVMHCGCSKPSHVTRFGGEGGE